MTDPNDDLRRLFTDATAEIRPAGTLDDMRSRTKKVDPMTRRWFLPALVAAAVLGLVIGGGFWLQHDDDASTSVVPSGPPTSAAPATARRAVPVYFVGPAARGERLYREFQPMDICAGETCLLQASVFAAVAAEPLDGDYVQPWPSSMAAPTASFDGTTITIDLGDSDVAARPDQMTASRADLAVQQLVRSAQAGLGKGRVPVRILLGGEPAPTVLGVPAATPLTGGNDDDVLALVSISSPTNNARVKAGDLVVKGTASAFEANVVWELLVGGDAVVMNGNAMAAECCTLSPYEFTIKGLAPGTYTLVVHDTDESGEGKPENRDSKEIIVE